MTCSIIFWQFKFDNLTAFFSSSLYATLSSITDFTVGAGSVKDLDRAIQRVAETAVRGYGGIGVTTSLFFAGFCSKGWVTLFQNFQAFFQLLKFFPFVVHFVVNVIVVAVELY